MKSIFFISCLVIVLLLSCTKDSDAPINNGNYIQVTTTAASSITVNSARSGGTIVSGGSDSVVVRGVCWSTSSNPTINNSKTADGPGGGTFTSVITNLTSNTIYYLRAYTNSASGTFYGNLKSFKTL